MTRGRSHWVLIAAFAVAGCFAAENGGKRWVRVTKTERADLAPGGTIRFRGSTGDLNVEGWDRSEVEITMMKSTKALYSERDIELAKERLDQIALTLQRMGPQELTISTAHPGPTWKHLWPATTDSIIEYRLHIPRNTHLVFHHRTGAVLTSGLTGDVDGSVKTGDIVVLVPKDAGYSIDAKSGFGNVESDFGGASRRRRIESHQLAFASSSGNGASSTHHLMLRVGIGDITIKEMPAPPKESASPKP
jgi:hypothetical protein